MTHIGGRTGGGGRSRCGGAGFYPALLCLQARSVRTKTKSPTVISLRVSTGGLALPDPSRYACPIRSQISLSGTRHYFEAFIRILGRRGTLAHTAFAEGVSEILDLRFAKDGFPQRLMRACGTAWSLRLLELSHT